MRRPGRLTDTDRAEWANYARQVAPLPGRRPPEPLAIQTAEAAVPASSGARSSAASRRPRPTLPPPLSIGEQPGGVDNATWNRFRSGRLRPARSLDLHGHTVQRAYHALLAALRGAHADRLRCIEIITGRGSGETGGAIRRELPLWLNLPELRPLLLAAAHPHPDNPGATRLLLRRPRPGAP